MERDPLLVEREKTHGNFAQNARYWDQLCSVVPRDWCLGQPPKRFAMNMIFMKIARAISNPNTKDTWDDIAGYAKLGAEACESSSSSS